MNMVLNPVIKQDTSNQHQELTVDYLIPIWHNLEQRETLSLLTDWTCSVNINYLVYYLVLRLEIFSV